MGIKCLDDFHIVGVDITGDYSEIEVNGFLKKTVSFLDHPINFSAKGIPRPQIDETNEKTSLAILDALFV